MDLFFTTILQLFSKGLKGRKAQDIADLQERYTIPCIFKKSNFFHQIGLQPAKPIINTDICWYKRTRRLRWAYLFACKLSLKHLPFGTLFAGLHGRAHRRHFGVGGWQMIVPRRI